MNVPEIYFLMTTDLRADGNNSLNAFEDPLSQC